MNTSTPLKMLRREEVESLTGLARSTLYRLVKEKKLAAPIPLPDAEVVSCYTSARVLSPFHSLAQYPDSIRARVLRWALEADATGLDLLMLVWPDNYSCFAIVPRYSRHARTVGTLGPIPERLYVLLLPDAGGAVALFAPDPATRGPSVTTAWAALEQQLKSMAGLILVVLDPLQPLCALDLNVPENAQFVCSRLAALAASTGASVIVSHHFAKRDASTPEQAREAIRGTGGLVDGVRSVYALWNPKEMDAKTICKTLGESFERGRVVMGGVVKANGRANLKVATFLRDTRGLLVDRSHELVRASQPDADLHPALKIAIARGAAEGSKLVKWLDVQDGPVARGEAVFITGHLSRSQPGMKDGA